jgi:hypothetical protein
MDPDEKGRELEIAVEAIEAVILESSPSLLGQPFQIERRKRINVDDVHHEIDIFVQVGAAKGYESTFIFECKNWEAPVGKNEIIVFSEKIDATVAQRGYVVAKGFTKDAFAQAAKDPRITTLYAIERSQHGSPGWFSHHCRRKCEARHGIPRQRIDWRTLGPDRRERKDVHPKWQGFARYGLSQFLDEAALPRSLAVVPDRAPCRRHPPDVG